MKIALIVLIVIMGIGIAALADPIDPDDDMIGIFFDEGAIDESWCATASTGSQITAYLCLTRATDSSGFTNWEGRIESSVPGSLVGFVIRGDGTNSAVEPEFVVSYDTPLPYQLSTVLLEINVEVVWQWPTGLRVWPASEFSGSVELPAYATVASAGVYQTLGYSFGWNAVTKVPAWCAAINDDTCLTKPSVPVDSATWGGVKALYR
ncbi:MAG: hypothetical protein KAH56_06210 [Candidatus Krumholzibacteria bacterium]|nr:hypothetical protein [Candidatus Krumholzibacteria bacterium]